MTLDEIVQLINHLQEYTPLDADQLLGIVIACIHERGYSSSPPSQNAEPDTESIDMYSDEDEAAPDRLLVTFVTHDGHTAWRLAASSLPLLPRPGDYVETTGKIDFTTGTHRVDKVVWAQDLSWVRVMLESRFPPHG